MDVDELKRKQNLLEVHRRRLHEREVQAAMYGLTVDPAITTEIEDIREKIKIIEQEIAYHSQHNSIPESSAPESSIFESRTDDNSNQPFHLQAEIERIWEILRAGGNVSIVGTSSRDKQSMLALLERECKIKLGSDVQACRLLLHRKVKLKDFKEDLAYHLDGELVKPKNLLRLLRNRRIIILLDDIGQLDQGEQGLEVRSWLRGLLQNRLTSTVQLVTTSRRPLREIFRADNAGDFSPLHNVMTNIVVLKVYQTE